MFHIQGQAFQELKVSYHILCGRRVCNEDVALLLNVGNCLPVSKAQRPRSTTVRASNLAALVLLILLLTVSVQCEQE